MESESSSVLERCATRPSLLRELIDAFLKAQRAIVLTDLQGIELCLARQRELCLALIALDDSADEQLARNADPTLQRKWDTLLIEIDEMERCAYHLGRVQAALLRRSRRAKDLLVRMLASTALTYSPPMVAASAASTGK
jgi:hypothetical protein